MNPLDTARAAALLGLLTGTAVAGPPVPSAVYGIPSVETCDDLVRLEPTAMMGRLTDGQRQCLEDRIQAAPTSEVHASELLMMDAMSRADRARWVALAERHMGPVAADDPDLAAKLALQQSRSGDALRAVHWAEYGLAHLDHWEGDTRVARTRLLYQARAQARMRLWEAAAEGDRDARAAEARPAVRTLRTFLVEHGKDPGKADAWCAQLGGCPED